MPNVVDTAVRWSSANSDAFSAATYASSIVLGDVGVISGYFVHAKRDLVLLLQCLGGVTDMIEYFSPFLKVSQLVIF